MYVIKVNFEIQQLQFKMPYQMGKKVVHYLCKAVLSNIRSTADVQINIDISNQGGGGSTKLQQTEISGALRYPKWFSNFNSVMCLYQHVFKYRYKLNLLLLINEYSTKYFYQNNINIFSLCIFICEIHINIRNRNQIIKSIFRE